MVASYTIIRKEYIVKDFRDGLDMENHIFIDLKAYQQIAHQLGITIGLNSESIIDEFNIINGSGYLIKGKRLVISVPTEFNKFFNSNTLLQFFK